MMILFHTGCFLITHYKTYDEIPFYTALVFHFSQPTEPNTVLQGQLASEHGLLLKRQPDWIYTIFCGSSYLATSVWLPLVAIPNMPVKGLLRDTDPDAGNMWNQFSVFFRGSSVTTSHSLAASVNKRTWNKHRGEQTSRRRHSDLFSCLVFFIPAGD